MAESEKITGAAIPKLFEELLHHKTLLKLTVVDSDYEHLAPIIDLVNRNKVPHFVIDTAEGLAYAIAEIDPCRLHFEFTGKDHIKYNFETIGGEIDGGVQEDHKDQDIGDQRSHYRIGNRVSHGEPHRCGRDHGQ